MEQLFVAHQSHNPAISEKLYEVFHPFPRLPFEIRRKIWTLFLEPIPRLYRFKLRYPFRITQNPYSNDLRVGDQVFLEPLDCSEYSKEPHSLSSLILLSHTRAIASTTCSEARHIVVEQYPDTIKFRCFPWDWLDGSHFQNPNGAGFPEYTLRFNNTRDIVVIHASWEDQATAIHISRLRSSPPDSFLNIRHVGLSVRSFKNDGCEFMRFKRWGPTGNGCKCTTNDCQDSCKNEPLPKFLALFPSLEGFYLAEVPESSHGELDRDLEIGDSDVKMAKCPCPDDMPKHTWPLIKCFGTCGNFATYNERSICPFPRLERVEAIRKNWRAHFPYYRALDHLEIKFIQPWDPTTFSSPPHCTTCKF